MKWLTLIFSVLHALMAVLFAGTALLLMIIGARQAWVGVTDGLQRASALTIVEALGIMAAAVVALQISQTIAEEEVLRDALISGPTRVRRFLSRFLVVVVVAVAIEGLVATFRAAHGEPVDLLYAAGHLVATGALLAGWGLFVRMNRYAEELEPEAMAQAKGEDRKLVEEVEEDA